MEVMLRQGDPGGLCAGDSSSASKSPLLPSAPASATPHPLLSPPSSGFQAVPQGEATRQAAEDRGQAGGHPHEV